MISNTTKKKPKNCLFKPLN